MVATNITLWTRQSPIVLKVLGEGKVYKVKRAYVDRKYEECSWSMQTAYGYLVRKMSVILPPDRGEESPVWLHGTAEATGGMPECSLLELVVPRNQCFFMDGRIWNKILNLSYVGADQQAEEKFNEKLDLQGITHASMVFKNNCYPLLRQEIVKSWDKLLTTKPTDKNHLQAAVWHIDPTWVKKVYEPY